MKLLLSNKKPLQVSQDHFLNAFEEYSSSAESIHISTGFVSIESLQYLLENVKAGNIPYLDLTIGMHHFDFFTRAQYDAALNLASYVKDSNKGTVSICVAFPYHGKVYTFNKKGKPFAAIAGSSNLSALGTKNAYNFEVDTAIEDPQILKELSEFQTQLQEKACLPFLEWQPKSFNENITIPGALKLSGKDAADYWQQKKISEYLIPLKPEPKSNLNVYFGKGRINKKKFIRPRPWYEVELIVPSNITSLPGYPYKSTFKVITDDGWMFYCKTSGDYSKNFRSENDLCILGTWIKGRLESSGLLKLGEPVSQSTLENYGKDHLKLTKTADSDIWLLELSQK